MTKCPHCNGLLDIRVTRHPPAENSESGRGPLFSALRQWAETPVTLSHLLIDMGYEGDLGQFDPLDRLVYRTAFRAKDFIRSSEAPMVPQFLVPTIQKLPGWANETTRQRFFGSQGRFWVRVGFGEYPGFIDAEDFEEITELV